jgi:two-component system response regulator QseB
MTPRILVVDDESSMREMLGIMLRKEGFEVLLTESRTPAAAVLAKGAVDMVITDVKLPDGDGIEILRHVKAAAPETVVLVMTAFGSTQTAVAALKLGAHDYLVKPFDVEELLARVRVLQRRLRGAASNVIEHGAVRLDPGALSVTHQGRPVALQRREFMLLQKLLAAPGQVLTRAQLEESLYGWEGNVESNALDVHVHNLRRKLYPEVIRTVRGVGYVADPA